MGLIAPVQPHTVRRHSSSAAGYLIKHAVHEAAAQSLAIRFDEKIDHEIQRPALI
jgi:hypothetical protein